MGQRRTAPYAKQKRLSFALLEKFLRLTVFSQKSEISRECYQFAELVPLHCTLIAFIYTNFYSVTPQIVYGKDTKLIWQNMKIAEFRKFAITNSNLHLFSLELALKWFKKT